MILFDFSSFSSFKASLFLLFPYQHERYFQPRVTIWGATSIIVY